MGSKLLNVILLCFFLGLIGLVVLNYFDSQPRQVWHYFGFELFALLASVGLVGVLFETLLREQLLAAVRGLFDTDPRLAGSLKDEVRAKLVESSLKGHLGEREGKAIYDNIVRRYLENKENPFRHNVDYNINIRNLPNAITIGEGDSKMVMDKDRYYHLITRYEFKKAFKWPTHLFVGCIFKDDAEEQNMWFGRQDCLFRNTIPLKIEDSESILGRLENLKPEELLQAISPIFKVKVEINGQIAQIDQQGTKLSSSKKSVEIKLVTPGCAATEEASFSIQVESVIDKAGHRVHVVLPDPSCAPRIVFSWASATGIKEVDPILFFTTSEPYLVNIDRDIPDRIAVIVPEDHWVFPHSGVVFTWSPS